MKELKDMSLEELWQLFPIILKEHNPDYIAWYSEEKASLLQVLLDHNIRRINHIGSTSVDGLIAKPIVDILLELSKGYDMSATVHLLQQNGWILMQKDDVRETLDLNKGYTPNGFAQKTFHLHVKSLGDWGELYFRDYLRENSDIAMQYETLKLSLIKQFEYDRDAYTKAKSEFITENTQKARVKYGGRYLLPECQLPFHQKANKQEEKMPANFVEIAVYQVKPTKVEEFENLLNEVVVTQREQAGLLDLKYIKREYHIDYEQIKEGLPPRKLTKIVKCVKYILIWEFKTKEDYGKALQSLFQRYDKQINRCLIAPHDKLLGGRIY